MLEDSISSSTRAFHPDRGRVDGSVDHYYESNDMS